MARCDLIDVVRGCLESAGLSPVFSKMPDGRRHPEATVVSFGVPAVEVVDYAGTERDVLRVTVIVKRISEERAMADAAEAERALRTSPLESQNGSYDLASVSAERPRPIPWDESGRYVYAFDAEFKTTRKDFF